MLKQDPLAHPAPLIRRVYSFVAYRIGEGADAEDVTSATFERAIRYRSTFDPRRGEPISWLLGIARREIGSYFGQRPVPAEFEPDASHEFADAARARVDLAAALRVLDDTDRELVALRYGADLTARQIGEVLGRKTNAVEVALHRALRKLRHELEEPAALEATGIPEITPAP